MTTQHTPGPWTVAASSNPRNGTKWRDIVSAGTEFCPSYVGEALERDAHLIAAAPELLELCKTILLRLDVEHAERIAKGETAPHFICAALRDDLRAASAKATGHA